MSEKDIISSTGLGETYHSPETNDGIVWPRQAARLSILTELVEEYRHQTCEIDELSIYASMPSLEYAIERAGMAENDDGKRHSNQRCLKRQDLKAATDKLRSRLSELKTCQTFSELHQIVCSTVSGVRGLGPLYAYDTAARLGANLGIAPNCVYLHASVRPGAKAVGVRYWQDFVTVGEFPAPVRTLAPHRIASFLCLYKDTLTKLALG